MKRLIRSRKGLSPVLSTVLMILVAITGMSLLFAFFVNYARDFQLGSGSAVRESVVIEDVWFKSPTQVEVWVYNAGKVEFKITGFYVDDKWASIDPSSDVAVSVGAHGKLIVSSEFALGAPPYNFKIVTERGSAFEGRYLWQ